MTKTYLVKGSKVKRITNKTAIDLMKHYSIVGSTYNDHGQIVYIKSIDNKRIHSILLSSKDL